MPLDVYLEGLAYIYCWWFQVSIREDFTEMKLSELRFEEGLAKICLLESTLHAQMYERKGTNKRQQCKFCKRLNVGADGVGR